MPKISENENGERAQIAEEQIAKLNELLTDERLAPGIVAFAKLLKEYRYNGYRRVCRYMVDVVLAK